MTLPLTTTTNHVEKSAIVQGAKSIVTDSMSKKKDETIKVKSLIKKLVKQLRKDPIHTIHDEDQLRIYISKTIEHCGEFELCAKKKTITSLKHNPHNETNTKGKKKRKHEQDTVVAAPTEDDLANWRKTHKIILLDSNKNANNNNNISSSYAPYQTFHDATAKIASSLIQHCTDVRNYKMPSPIQAQCWPVLLDLKQPDSTNNNATTIGRDLIGIAETGSGKTLAFALPALSLMTTATSPSNTNTTRLPRMLVLAPTRELAMQSHEVLAEFGTCVNLTSLVVYGGVPKPPQAIALRKKRIDCIVATPGRLKDFINDGTIDLSNITYLVLDEADRMLDMGFQEDVEYIIGQCRPREQRQTSMFSATWPAAIQQLAAEYMVQPARVYVGFQAIVGSGDKEDTNGDGCVGVDDSLSANKRVQQIVEVIDDRAREHRLRQLLQDYTRTNNNKTKNKNTSKDASYAEEHLEHDRILVFALYKAEAERLERTVRQWGYNVGSINGNKSQDARTQSLASFKDGSCPLLIATDVASRGLDIPNVEVVLNYTFPLTIEDYVHRIGRTGRAGKTGISHTFFQPGDKSHAGELQSVLRQAGQSIPDELMKFGSTIKKKEHKLYGAFGGNSSVPMKQATRIKFD